MNYGFALILAIISPVFWALTNIIDKFLVSNKLKNYYSYMFLAGIFHIMISLVLALFIDWSGFSLRLGIFSIISAAALGFQIYFYLWLMKREDVSSIIGLVYVYPLFIALLSFLFLNETISLIGYFGMFFAIIGVLILSHKKEGSIFGKASFLFFFIFLSLSVVYEFFIKISTNNLNYWQGFVIGEFVLGMIIGLSVFSKKTRTDLRYDVKHAGWILLAEASLLLGILTSYASLTVIQVTIFSSLATAQPLLVLFFEFFVNKRIKGFASDIEWSKKTWGIVLICLGVVLLAIN